MSHAKTQLDRETYSVHLDAESRRMFVSAMTLLERQDGQAGTSYVDLLQLISDLGAQNHINADLEQLYRRVVFNVLVGNRTTTFAIMAICAKKQAGVFRLHST